MRNIFLFMVVALLFNAGCNAQSSKKNNNVTNDTRIDSRLNPILLKFGLPYDGSLLTDSNSLVFYYLKSFDTSFLLHLKRIDNKVLGTYYSVLPSYHRDVEDYYNEEAGLLFFEGFSFKIDIVKWQQILYEAQFIVNSDTTLKSESCFDCAYYFLSHQGLIRQSNQNNRKLFASYAFFLKEQLLNQFNKLRRPVL